MASPVFTYDPTTNRGRVRLLIQDTDTSGPPEKQLFTDVEIDAFLGLEDGVFTAAALALETMASQQAMVLKVISLLDLTTNGAAVSSALLERAKRLRELADVATEDEQGVFDWAEMITTTWAGDERVWNEALRGE